VLCAALQVEEGAGQEAEEVRNVTYMLLTHVVHAHAPTCLTGVYGAIQRFMVYACRTAMSSHLACLHKMITNLGCELCQLCAAAQCSN
jgi:hypothetical protein